MTYQNVLSVSDPPRLVLLAMVSGVKLKHRWLRSLVVALTCVLLVVGGQLHAGAQHDDCAEDVCALCSVCDTPFLEQGPISNPQVCAFKATDPERVCKHVRRETSQQTIRAPPL